jgi:hypothetical protein
VQTQAETQPSQAATATTTVVAANPDLHPQNDILPDGYTVTDRYGASYLAEFNGGGSFKNPKRFL